MKWNEVTFILTVFVKYVLQKSQFLIILLETFQFLEVEISCKV